MFAVPLYLLQIYDKVIPSRSTDTLIVLTIIVLGALLALGFLESIRRKIFRKTAADFEMQIGEHLLSSAISRSSRKSVASVNVLKDLTRIRSFFSSSGLISILDLPWTPVYVIVLFFLHPYIGALVLVGCISLFGLAVINERITKQSVLDADELNKGSIDNARSYVDNADVIQAMGMQDQILAKWKQQNASALRLSNNATEKSAKLASWAKSLRLFLQVSVIFLAAWLILNSELTPGATIASVLLMRRAVSPIESSIRSWKSFQKSRSSIENINKHLLYSPSLKDNKSMPKPDGDLVLQKISYKHKGAKSSILRSIDLTVSAGESIAITGSTAAGKSTLSRLIVGLIAPTTGRVLLNGFELNQWSPSDLGPHLGFLPQDVELFSGTIRENIARLQTGDIAEVIAAAKLAKVHDIILKMPDGYDTDIGDGGSFLSGGQRQRIALARAVYKIPRIVVLDEPDANLDDDGKAALAVTINKLTSQGSMVIVVTHHKSIRKFVDKVYKLSSRGLRLETSGDSSSGNSAKKPKKQSSNEEKNLAKGKTTSQRVSKKGRSRLTNYPARLKETALAELNLGKNRVAEIPAKVATK